MQMGKKKGRRTSDKVARAQNGVGADRDLKDADDTELTAAALAATNELLATAKELYRSLGGESPDGDSADEGEGDEEDEGAYWRTHMRSDADFASRVREAAAALAPTATENGACYSINNLFEYFGIFEVEGSDC